MTPWPWNLKKMTKITIKPKIDQNTPWNLYLQDQNDNKNAIQPLYLLDLKPINFKINRFKMPWCEICREVVFEEKRKRIAKVCKGSIERTTSGPETREEEKVMGSDSIYFGNLKRKQDIGIGGEKVDTRGELPTPEHLIIALNALYLLLWPH